MKQLPKHIEVIDCYDFNELMSKAPFFTDIYSVEVGKYGFLHDVGIKVDFYLDGKGKGWNSLKADFDKTVKYVKDCWDMANNFAYH